MLGQAALSLPVTLGPCGSCRWLCDSELSCLFFFFACVVFVAICELSLVAVVGATL